MSAAIEVSFKIGATLPALAAKRVLTATSTVRARAGATVGFAAATSPCVSIPLLPRQECRSLAFADLLVRTIFRSCSGVGRRSTAFLRYDNSSQRGPLPHQSEIYRNTI